MKPLLLLAALFLLALSSPAQSPAATAYEFLVVVESESRIKGLAKLLFAPAFQGKTEAALEALPGTASTNYWPTYQRNLETVAQQLGALSAAGWELVEGAPTLEGAPYQSGHRYLFRRLKQ